MKIGERGGKSFVILCLSKMNTPRLTLEELSWLKTLAFYTNVSIENVMKIEELMSHLEEIKQQESNPVWLKKLMYTIEEKTTFRSRPRSPRFRSRPRSPRFRSSGFNFIKTTV